MDKKRNGDAVGFSDYPPWLKIFIVLIIALVFLTAFVPGWILYTGITIMVVSFIAISYWFYKKRGINVPKKMMKSTLERYKKMEEDWIKEQKRQTEGKPRKPISRGLYRRMLIRSHGRCENCGRDLFNVKTDIHHKNYDPTDPRESNLLVVCKPCHKKLTGPRPRE